MQFAYLQNVSSLPQNTRRVSHSQWNQRPCTQKPKIILPHRTTQKRMPSHLLWLTQPHTYHASISENLIQIRTTHIAYQHQYWIKTMTAQPRNPHEPFKFPVSTGKNVKKEKRQCQTFPTLHIHAFQVSFIKQTRNKRRKQGWLPLPHLPVLL